MTAAHRAMAAATATRADAYESGWSALRISGMTPSKKAVAAINRQVGFSRCWADTSEVSQW